MPWLELRTAQWSAHHILWLRMEIENKKRKIKIKANTFHVTGLVRHTRTLTRNTILDLTITIFCFLCLPSVKLTRKLEAALYFVHMEILRFKSFQQINNSGFLSLFSSIPSQNRKCFIWIIWILRPPVMGRSGWERDNFQMNALIVVDTIPHSPRLFAHFLLCPFGDFDSPDLSFRKGRNLFDLP